jgi:hypothetical protein
MVKEQKFMKIVFEQGNCVLLISSHCWIAKLVYKLLLTINPVLIV